MRREQFVSGEHFDFGRNFSPKGPITRSRRASIYMGEPSSAPFHDPNILKIKPPTIKTKRRETLQVVPKQNHKISGNISMAEVSRVTRSQSRSSAVMEKERTPTISDLISSVSDMIQNSEDSLVNLEPNECEEVLKNLEKLSKNFDRAKLILTQKKGNAEIPNSCTPQATDLDILTRKSIKLKVAFRTHATTEILNEDNISANRLSSQLPSLRIKLHRLKDYPSNTRCSSHNKRTMTSPYPTLMNSSISEHHINPPHSPYQLRNNSYTHYLEKVSSLDSQSFFMTPDRSPVQQPPSPYKIIQDSSGKHNHLLNKVLTERNGAISCNYAGEQDENIPSFADIVPASSQIITGDLANACSII